MVGRGDLEHVLLALLGGVGDLAVVEDDGVAVGTALGVGPANALGEAGLGVGEEELEGSSQLIMPQRKHGGYVRETYNVIASDTVGLAPGAHDVGIVVGQDGNNVDALGAQLGELLDVLGDVVGGADGGEGTCRWGGGQ